MGKPKKILIALLLVVFAAIVQGQQDITDIDIGEFSLPITARGGQFKYFRIRINRNQFDGSQDLLVKVTPADYSSDPDVYISKNNRRPDGYDTSEWICSTYGKDTCAINHRNISAGDDFYVGVKCYSDCSFNIYPTLQHEIVLSDGVEMQINFGSQESKIFKFYIPKNIASDEYNRINSVTVIAAPFLSGTQELMLSATTRRNQIPTSSSRRGVSAWTKGQALRLSENFQDEWCTDCNVTILVDVVDPGRYSVVAKTNQGISKLYEGKKIDDVAYYGDQVCYKYYVLEAEKDIIIRTTLYSGLTTFFMNPGYIPQTYDDAYYSSASTYSNSLIVTSRERKANGTSTGLYYICVYPHVTSTYSLLVQEVEKNQNFRNIEHGFSENVELQGTEMKTFLYKVPPLDYADEDITLEFNLATQSGPQPIMAVGFCDEKDDPKRCLKNLKRGIVLDPKNRDFQRATLKGTALDLVIDHNEKQCKTEYNNECYYAIVVFGTGEEEDYSKFAVSVSHSQQNYQSLIEGELIEDYVEIGQYRYFKFSLIDDENVKNVTFMMNTFHGDADLYVSRTTKFPNKHESEKASLRVTGLVDSVFFDSDTLSTTYYIGVYGYQYSTYTLVAKIDRDNVNGQDTVIQLTEGMPARGQIHLKKKVESVFKPEQLPRDHYRFSVKMQEGYEKSIKLNLQPLGGNMKMFVNIGKQATYNDHIWGTDDNHIEITPKDNNYNREATYFVAIYPSVSVWDLFRDPQYGYQISYSTQASYTYLQTKSTTEVKQSAGTVDYFRHFISEFNSDLDLSMTIYSGTPNIYLSVDPSKKWPSYESNDYQPKDGGQHSQGRSFTLKSEDINRANPACTNKGLSQVEPCALYIAVNCTTDCQYSLKVSYDNSLPHQLIIGQPQHDVVNEDTYKYYYMNVRENKFKDIHAVLNSLSGNADLFVKFYNSDQMKDRVKWVVPTKSDYSLKSSELLSQDTIHIKAEELKDCFSSKGRKSTDENECTLVFGVYGAQPEDTSSSSREQLAAMYNFVVYTDMLQLINNSPHTSQVEKDEYQYYLYEATCKNCTIIASVSTYSTGNPDLFINFGDTKLPSRSSYDIGAATFKSETLEININNKHFVENNITSMKGTYILAVYGNSNSTYTISITQEQYPLVYLVEGQSVRSSVDSFKIAYYKWYNWRDEDIKIQLNIRHGLADIYVGTIDENKPEQNLVNRLPSSKRNTVWLKENITPTSSIQQSELLIVTTDRQYCKQCTYLIGIVTHEHKTDFSLLLESLKANFKNSQLLKLGEVQKSSIAKDETKLFKFIIDEKAPVQVIITVITGNVWTNIAFTEDETKAFAHAYGSSSIKIDKDSKDLKTDTMYYLIMKSEQESQFKVQVTQERSIIQLADGVPQTLTFGDNQDLAKNLVLSLPPGDQTVTISIKSKTHNFYPTLYVAYYEDVQILEDIEFAPSFWSGVQTMQYTGWDFDLKHLKYTHTYNKVPYTGNPMLALSIRYVTQLPQYVGIPLVNLDTNPGQVVVTASYSNTIQLMPEVEYAQTLTEGQHKFALYQVTAPETKTLVVEFANCIGDTDFAILKKKEDIDQWQKKGINVTREDRNGKTQAFLSSLKGDYFIYAYPKNEKNHKDIQKREFIIKTKESNFVDRANTEFAPGNGGQIDYTLDKDNQLTLSWALPTYKSGPSTAFEPNKFHGAEFRVIITADTRIRVDSMCALRADMYDSNTYHYYTTNKTELSVSNMIQPANQYSINVFARLGEFDEWVPYQGITLSVAKGWLPQFKSIAIFLALLVALMGCIMFFKQKAQRVLNAEHQPEYELQSVRHPQKGLQKTTTSEPDTSNQGYAPVSIDSLVL